jgi:hypothetical protein
MDWQLKISMKTALPRVIERLREEREATFDEPVKWLRRANRTCAALTVVSCDFIEVETLPTSNPPGHVAGLLDARAYLESQFNLRMKSRIRIGNGKSARRK